jgi:hypothetical protein
LSGVTPDPASSAAELVRLILDTLVNPPEEEAVWTRPEDWLELPTLNPGDEKFVGLFAVTDDDSNYLALSAAGNYTVDWGDGTAPENVASGVTAEHIYSFAAIPSSTLTSRGYRQAIVTVTPQGGQQLTNLNLNKKHTGIPGATTTTNWLEISLNSPNFSSMTVGSNGATKLNILENVILGQIGTITTFANLLHTSRSLRSVIITESSAVIDFSGMFNGCNALQLVSLFDTSAGTNFSSMFSSCSALRAVPLFNTASGTNFNLMFNGCRVLDLVPLFNTANGINFGSMFTTCLSLLLVPLFNTAGGTDFSGMFTSCGALQSVPLFNTAFGTNFSGMFTSCGALQSVPLFNTAAATNLSGMLTSCFDLATGVLSGTKKTISYTQCKLSHQAIVDIFNALGVAVAQTITVSNTPGFAALTAPEIAIATGKGWIVA